MKILKFVNKFLVCLLILFTFSVDNLFAIGPSDYILHQSLTLAEKEDGINGKLQLLRDRRLTNDDIAILQQHDPESALALKVNSFHPSVIRLVNSRNKIVKKISLEKLYANIETKKIKKDSHRIILITQDFGIGMGSYNGPITKILVIGPRKMSWAVARNLQTGHLELITLMRSLKTAWDFSAEKNDEKDILKVSCRFDENAKKSGFTTTYSRYHYLKNKWVLKKRSEDLLWEDESEDGKLPSVELFPKI